MQPCKTAPAIVISYRLLECQCSQKENAIVQAITIRGKYLTFFTHSDVIKSYLLIKIYSNN